MLNFKEIFKAWVSASNPTKQQSDLAEARLNICIGCQYKKEIINKKEWSAICGKCGCPLKAKVFSDSINPCPMGFWKNIDSKFGLNTSDKNNTSFI